MYIAGSSGGGNQTLFYYFTTILLYMYMCHILEILVRLYRLGEVVNLTPPHHLNKSQMLAYTV